MAGVELTVEAATAQKPKFVRRHSAVGMAFHHWQESGKPTIIQCVLELAADISTEALTELVDTRLLKRFPRFRGYVSDGRRHWVVPESVDPCRYVSSVDLDGSDHRAALTNLLGAETDKALPAQCSWQIVRVTCAGRVALLFRAAHTVADAVMLVTILQHGLCDAPAPAAVASGGAVTSSTTPPPRASAIARAGCLERLWAVCFGLFFVLFVLCWPSDRRTAISLGPSAWRRRKRLQAAQGQTAGGGAVVALSSPVSVGAVKAAARAHGATVNDVLMAALAAGLSRYLSARADAAAARAQPLTLTATMFVNPRRVAFNLRAEVAQPLLDEYAAMSTRGCDLGFGFLPLPCGGALAPDARLAAVLRLTRRIKLSPEVPLFLLAMSLAYRFLLGPSLSIRLAEHILSKTSLCASNVLVSTGQVAVGGVAVEAIYGGAAPIDYGTGFTFLSYNGEVTCCCTADQETVPAPQELVEHVHAALLEYCGGADVEAPA